MLHVVMAVAAVSSIAPLIACAEHLPLQQSARPGLYATKAEAEAAAKNFNCSGAHRMGNQWMPCSTHPSAETQAPTAGPGLYATKAEAEAAAKKFNCSGAHRMGNQWMPCMSHPTSGSGVGAPTSGSH